MSSSLIAPTSITFYLDALRALCQKRNFLKIEIFLNEVLSFFFFNIFIRFMDYGVYNNTVQLCQY